VILRIKTVLFIIFIIFAPFLSIFVDIKASFIPFLGFSAEHILGTDDMGRSIAKVLAVSISNTASFGIIAAFTAGILSLILTSLSTFSSFFKIILNNLSTVFLSIPFILIIILAASAGTVHPYLLAVLLGVLGWAGPYRLFSAKSEMVAKSGYVHAARQMGASDVHVFVKHILPQIFSLVTVVFGGKFRNAVFLEAVLGFLGLFEGSYNSMGVMLKFSLNSIYEPNGGIRFLISSVALSFLVGLIYYLAMNSSDDLNTCGDVK